MAGSIRFVLICCRSNRVYCRVRRILPNLNVYRLDCKIGMEVSFVEVIAAGGKEGHHIVLVGVVVIPLEGEEAYNHIKYSISTLKQVKY